MAKWRRHSGDTGDVAIVRDLGIGSVAGVNDLSTVTSVVAHVQYGGATPVVLTAAVTDAANSEVTVHLGTLPADWLPAGPTLGCWKFRRVYHFTGGIGPITWPEGDPDEIIVERAG